MIKYFVGMREYFSSLVTERREERWIVPFEIIKGEGLWTVISDKDPVGNFGSVFPSRDFAYKLCEMYLRTGLLVEGRPRSEYETLIWRDGIMQVDREEKDDE